MYERHRSIGNSPGTVDQATLPSLSEQEIGHWYLATSCFNKHLASALTSTGHRNLGIQQQAALCATSVLLSVLTFCYIEARTFQEAWPLASGPYPSALEDLQWIKMSNGKKSAMTLTTGLATDSVFRSLVVVDEQDKANFSFYNTNVISVTEYKSFQDLSRALQSPEAEAFTQTANSNHFVTIIFGFWSFVGSMTTEFEQSLRNKEPAALMVLLYWYAKLKPLPVWWLKARTTLEGQAICTYLDCYYGRDPGIKQLLRWPTFVLWGAD